VVSAFKVTALGTSIASPVNPTCVRIYTAIVGYGFHAFGILYHWCLGFVIRLETADPSSRSFDSRTPPFTPWIDDISRQTAAVDFEAALLSTPSSYLHVFFLNSFLCSFPISFTVVMNLFLRQIWALIRKNLLIIVVRRPVSTFIRAIALPLVVVLVIAYSKNFFASPETWGISSPHSVRQQLPKSSV
jgi:hypothetical protein